MTLQDRRRRQRFKHGSEECIVSVGFVHVRFLDNNQIECRSTTNDCEIKLCSTKDMSSLWAVAIRRPNQWSGVSPFKGRLIDEIPDAEYKVVEHQIAPPLDPPPRWRFQRLPRGTGSGLGDASYAELVKPSTDVPPTTFRTVEPELFERILDQTLGGPKLTERPILVLPVSKYFASVYKICQAMVDLSSKPGDA